MSTDARNRCTVCGVEREPSDQPTEWLSVQVTRGDPSTPAEIDWLEASFCSSEHASAWFADPRPSPRGPATAARARLPGVRPGLSLNVVLALLGFAALLVLRLVTA